MGKLDDMIQDKPATLATVDSPHPLRPLGDTSLAEPRTAVQEPEPRPAVQGPEPVPVRDAKVIPVSPSLDAATLAKYRIISPDNASDSASNAFRELRTRLLKLSDGKPFTLQVTSVDHGQGASHVAVNLAVAIASDARYSAVLIDSSDHEPAYHLPFRGEKEDQVGLFDYLRSPELSLTDVVHTVGVPRLQWIPAGSGRDQPGEYLASEAMDSLLSQIKNSAPNRFVVVDTSPLRRSADSQIVTSMCDFVLVVVGYGQLMPGTLERILSEIDPAKLAGVVLNGKPQILRQFLTR